MLTLLTTQYFYTFFLVLLMSKYCLSGHCPFTILISLDLRVLAEEELKTNIAETEVFVLPSGQQIEKEGNSVAWDCFDLPFLPPMRK